ncbi:hypothetical protein ZIOFF_005784 [Zingiber officinale]|uniref:EDR1/CTR1/ARMC3-like peptidase-like domain-containing protein n=1 Tax=Zingiber officinale TaxID=94328 RepID=A0A8J5HMT6_ZINOF|nr:hypothetical protein ZIOFF_005784 [Zingiber officinale]
MTWPSKFPIGLCHVALKMHSGWFNRVQILCARLSCALCARRYATKNSGAKHVRFSAPVIKPSSNTHISLPADRRFSGGRLLRHSLPIPPPSFRCIGIEIVALIIIDKLCLSICLLVIPRSVGEGFLFSSSPGDGERCREHQLVIPVSAPVRMPHRLLLGLRSPCLSDISPADPLPLLDRISRCRVASGGLYPEEFRAGLDEDRRPLLRPQGGGGLMPTPEMLGDQDRRVLLPLQRLPSVGGSSSFVGSVFTVDGNVLSGTTATLEGTDSLLEVVEGCRDALRERNWAQRARESYYLQSSLAARLTSQAFLAGQPLLLPENFQETCSESSDSETVSYRLWVGFSLNDTHCSLKLSNIGLSYRLWVNGCLSYSDKITDGFYNILGMDPHLWAMCNEPEVGRRLPTLMALNTVDPNDSSMEAILVDKYADPNLSQLEDRALEYSCALGFTLELVEKLAKLVSDFMGYAWVHSKQSEEIFIDCGNHIAKNLGNGKDELADYIRIPYRIARGCKYCSSTLPSSCLVKVEDAKKSLREYMVDLVGELGKVCNPDSSINGHLLSSLPSPFQFPHLHGFKNSYTEMPWNQMFNEEQTGTFVGNSHYAA